MARSVWDEVLDTEHAVVVRTYIEQWPRKNRAPEKVLIIVVEPDEETRYRCPRCGQRGRPAEHDVVRWRTLDVHGKRTYLESELPRIICGEHGKITAAVPRARQMPVPGGRSRSFAAWKAVHMAWTRAAAHLRITWGGAGGHHRAGRRGRRGRAGPAGGAAPDRDRREVLGQGPGQVPDHRHRPRPRPDRAHRRGPLPGHRARVLRGPGAGPGGSPPAHVSADGADWIHDVVREKAAQAELCLDAFHVVKWAGDGSMSCAAASRASCAPPGVTIQAATLGTGMWALRKAPEKLNGNQRTALASIAADNNQLVQGVT